MAEYIERGALLSKLKERDLVLCVTERDVREATAADVVEVRHGKWLHVHVAVVDTTGDCSVCNTEAVWRTQKKPYSICPNCGARMDGDSNA